MNLKPQREGKDTISTIISRFDEKFGKGKTRTENGLYSLKGWADIDIKTFLEKELKGLVGKIVEEVDTLIQHPPPVQGDTTVCIDLDEWEKFIKNLEKKY